MSPKEFSDMGAPYDDFCPKCKKSKRECTCERYVSSVNKKKKSEVDTVRIPYIKLENRPYCAYSIHPVEMEKMNIQIDWEEVGLVLGKKAKRSQRKTPGNRGADMSGLK